MGNAEYQPPTIGIISRYKYQQAILDEQFMPLNGGSCKEKDSLRGVL